HTEADTVEKEMGRQPAITEGRADPRGLSLEPAGTLHAVVSNFQTIFLVFTWLVFLRPGIVFVDVLAPSLNIPVHVKQTQIVRLLAPHRPGSVLGILHKPAILPQQLL